MKKDLIYPPPGPVECSNGGKRCRLRRELVTAARKKGKKPFAKNVLGGGGEPASNWDWGLGSQPQTGRSRFSRHERPNLDGSHQQPQRNKKHLESDRPQTHLQHGGKEKGVVLRVAPNGPTIKDQKYEKNKETASTKNPGHRVGNANKCKH